MGLHSKILVHWTGRDFEQSPSGSKPQQYVDLLKDDCQKGLYAKRVTEASIRGIKLKYLVRLCFTEIRLSQAKTHAERYGKLGIGFAREFIMDKGGRPVIYIPFEPKKGGCLLEDSIAAVHERSRHDPDIHRAMKWIMAHVKRMSNEKGEDFFEEMEWRLVYDEHPQNKHFTPDRRGVYRLKFNPTDVRVLVFPDEDTKSMALGDQELRQYFSTHIPIIATLDECSSF